MDVTKQMEDAVYSALIEGEIKSGKVKSDVSEIFKEITTAPETNNYKSKAKLKM